MGGRKFSGDTAGLGRWIKASIISARKIMASYR